MDERRSYCPNCGEELPEDFAFYVKDEDETCRHITNLVEEDISVY